LRGSQRLSAGLSAVIAVAVFASAASAQTSILAFSGQTLNESVLDPLIGFGSGRHVAIHSHMSALVRHSAADDDIVLVRLDTGSVFTADPALGDDIWYEESGVGRDVAKFLSVPGGALLFETSAGNADPASATSARYASPSGATLRLAPDRGFQALPEPGLVPGLIAGATLMVVLRRLRRPRGDLGREHIGVRSPTPAREE
jgi:hypothetical protein